MKDIDQIRRENMLLLEQESGGATAAAERSGMTQPQWSNLRSGALDSKTKKPRGMRKETARKIEGGHGKPPMWLDSEHGLLPSSNTQNGSDPAESRHANDKDSAMLLNFPKMSPGTLVAPDNYIIRQYAAGGSMGHGLTLPDQPGVIENWSVSREWLNKNVRNHTSVQNLCIVTGFGPSMEPKFKSGDPLLVDTGVTQWVGDGIYFFRIGEFGIIKQLQMIPTPAGIKYEAVSANKDFKPFDITADMDFEILGRVVKAWCGTDF